MLDKLIQYVPLLSYYPPWVRIWVVVFIISVAATAIILLINLPAALETKQAKDARELEAKRRIAHIEFENKEPFVDLSVIRVSGIKGRWRTYLYSIRIVNDSDESSIRVRHLKLTDLEMLEGDDFKPWENAEPFILKWNRNKPEIIPPGDNVLAQFIRIYPPELQQFTDKGLWTGPYDIPQLRFISTSGPGAWPMKMISKVPEGTHRFKLTAYFDNAPPAEAWLELKCPPEEGRASNPEALVREIEIGMLGSGETL